MRLRGNHPHGNHPHGNHPHGNHPNGNHPNGNHPHGNHPHGNHPNGNHPNGNHPNGNHPNGNHQTLRLKELDNDFIYDPSKRTICFYQITSFPVKGKHQVRKLLYNERLEVIDIQHKKISTPKIKRFTESTAHHRFNLYPAYDLDMVEYPNDGEVLTAQSLILNLMV